MRSKVSQKGVHTCGKVVAAWQNSWSGKACLRHCARVVGGKSCRPSQPLERPAPHSDIQSHCHLPPSYCEQLKLKRGASADRSGSTLCQRKGVFLALEAGGGALICHPIKASHCSTAGRESELLNNSAMTHDLALHLNQGLLGCASTVPCRCMEAYSKRGGVQQKRKRTAKEALHSMSSCLDVFVPCSGT